MAATVADLEASLAALTTAVNDLVAKIAAIPNPSLDTAISTVNGLVSQLNAVVIP